MQGSPLTVTALDIGGANLKAVGPDGKAVSRPFELWRRPEGLADALEDLLCTLGQADILAVTMTGELCDCFETKSEGVHHCLDSARRASKHRGKQQLLVWSTEGKFLSLADALRDPLPVAAANWLALAAFAGSLVPEESALLVDVGSTTTDIVPLASGGHPAPAGLTDTERLLCGELVYSGVSRTPIATVVRKVPYRGQLCPVSSELFATTQDAYLVLGSLKESPEDLDTADGRPATRACARDRLGRMVCADRKTFSAEDAVVAARHIASTQAQQLQKAVEKVVGGHSSPVTSVVLSGSGEFLGGRAVAQTGARIVSLSSELGRETSRAATAHALAYLVQKELAQKESTKRASL
jgi:probable H4MPT-linked C1 transfer pathway protein